MDYEFVRAQIRDSDTIICADSGYNHAIRIGLKVCAVVGDFDSVGAEPQGALCVRYPSRKDLTDTEIAIEYARQKGFRDFLLLAATGSRLDHTLANIFLLRNFLERGESAAIVDEHNKIMITDSQLRLYEPVGTIVSLVPLTDCIGVATQGLEYSLRGEDMPLGKGRGVSNVATEDSALVSVLHGPLLVITARD
jgi:thiamine pyrophosphokinase